MHNRYAHAALDIMIADHIGNDEGSYGPNTHSYSVRPVWRMGKPVNVASQVIIRKA